MPSPNSVEFERPDLGAAYESFDHQAWLAGLVGLRVLRPFKTGVAAGNFTVVPPAEYHRVNSDRVKRAAGATYDRDEGKFGQASFACQELGKEELLDDRERAIYGYTGLNFDQNAANRAVYKVLLANEVTIASKVQDSSGLSAQATAAGTKFDQYSSATPLAKLLGARESFRTLNGIYPNALVIEATTLSHIKACDEYKDRVKHVYGLKEQADAEAGIAALLDLDEVIVAKSSKNTAAEGLDPSFSGIWDKTICSLVRVAKTDDLREMCTGRTFMFEDLIIDEYRAPDRRSDVMRARIDLDPVLIQSSLIWMLTGCL